MVEVGAPALVRMLDDAAAWRERVGRSLEAGLDAIAAEERTARRALEEAQRRHAAVLALRREEEQRIASLDEELTRRKRAAVGQALAIDRAALLTRAAALTEAIARREAALAERLADPALAPAVRLWLEAREAARAAGDRDVARWVPPAARARLEEILNAASGPPPRLALPRVGVGVLVSSDPPIGRPEALVLVAPVPWDVYAEGSARAEDLCTRLAYRLVAGLYGLLAEIGASGAPVRFLDVEGCLAVQLWLGDHRVGEDLRERALAAISAAVDGADELAAAAVEVYAVWLAPELVAGASA